MRLGYVQPISDLRSQVVECILSAMRSVLEEAQAWIFKPNAQRIAWIEAYPEWTPLDLEAKSRLNHGQSARIIPSTWRIDWHPLARDPKGQKRSG